MALRDTEAVLDKIAGHYERIEKASTGAKKIEVTTAAQLAPGGGSWMGGGSAGFDVNGGGGGSGGGMGGGDSSGGSLYTPPGGNPGTRTASSGPVGGSNRGALGSVGDFLSKLFGLTKDPVFDRPAPTFVGSDAFGSMRSGPGAGKSGGGFAPSEQARPGPNDGWNTPQVAPPLGTGGGGISMGERAIVEAIERNSGKLEMLARSVGSDVGWRTGVMR